MNGKIYLDYAATTPTDPEVIKAMEPHFFKEFGNASSPHSIGRRAQKFLEDARQTIAQFIAANPQEIIFNSGATEGNNHVILSTARVLKSRGKHVIISAIEHHSILEPLEILKRDGFRVTYVDPDERGVVKPNDIKKHITSETILIAVMHASNEIGTIQPVSEIGTVARQNNIPFLVDACQTVGHIPVDVSKLNADFLSFSAHKFYGPQGVGALFVRKGFKLSPFLIGGDQESGQRASTQNIPGIVGMAKAVELCQRKMKDESEQQTVMRNRLLNEVPKEISGVKVNGHLTDRLPNNAHFSFEHVQGEALLMGLDLNGICASMGSACTSGAMEPSHVLKAIGLSDELAMGSLRITVGRWTTNEDIDRFLKELPAVVGSLRI